MYGMPRFKAWLLLAGCLIFAGKGLLLVVDGDEKGWGLTAFFVIGVVVAVCSLWPALLLSKVPFTEPLVDVFPGPVTLREDPRRTAVILIAAVGFAGCVLWVWYQATPDWRLTVILLPGVLLFGCGVPLLALMLVKPDSLELRADGFVTTRLWRIRHVPWGETSAFEVVTISSNNPSIVAFDETSELGRVVDLNVRLTGRTSSLRSTYGLSPGDLAGLLNRWRDLALSRQANSLAIAAG